MALWRGLELTSRRTTWHIKCPPQLTKANEQNRVTTLQSKSAKIRRHARCFPNLINKRKKVEQALCSTFTRVVELRGVEPLTF